MSIVFDMLLNGTLAFVGTIGFSIIFNVPRRELLFCGIGGAMGWLLFTALSDSPFIGVLLGAMAVTWVSRILSMRRKKPATLYMIPGIIPLVPGVGIYFTMFYIVTGEHYQALLRGVQTLGLAGVIALGMLIVLSLPRRLINFGKKVG